MDGTTDKKQNLEKLLLEYIDKHNNIDNTRDWLNNINGSNNDIYDHNELINICKSLSSEQIIQLNSKDIDKYVLTNEAQLYIHNGTPEIQLYNAVSTDDKGTTRSALEQKLGKDIVQIGQSQCMINKWLIFDKQTKSYIRNISHNNNDIVDTVQQQLILISNSEHDKLDNKTIDSLKKRKMIIKQIDKLYSLVKGQSFTLQRKKIVYDLTSDMIRNNEWQNVTFKPFNLGALGTPLQPGTLHPLMKVRSEFRLVLLGMGFSEMSTSQYVESSFWNFDSLFQPQNHPARDQQDTFFVQNPAQTVRLPDKDYVERVKQVHENGGTTGSTGYMYEWKYDESLKNILRTHTTSVSSRMLYKLANMIDSQTGNKLPFKPIRLFSIDRVFRNETLDATHLAEFHQVEGVVADVGLTLSDLIGVLEQFFNRIGISNIKFKPAYNPYTEPSMEIFGFSTQLNKWIEIGNSGMFRPEMLLPMNLPSNVRVIAWGLSLERPTMIKYGIKNIRDLFGHKVKLDIIQNNPIARYDYYLPEYLQSHHVTHPQQQNTLDVAKGTKVVH